MIEYLKSFWATFHNNETIIWARVQMAVGALWVAASTVDLSPILPAKYLPLWLVLNGFITEMLRRNRAKDLT